LISILALSTQLQTVIGENKRLSDTVSNTEKALAECCVSYIPELTKSRLLQNQPNPFNEKTAIGFTLPECFNKAEIKVFNNNGEIVKIKVVIEEATNVYGGSSAQYLCIYVLEFDRITLDSKR
jgi:hypothetical protein